MMSKCKKVVFVSIFFIMIIVPKIKAQNDVTLAFNSVEIGRNMSLIYSKSLNRHRIIAGIKYSINSFVQDNQNQVFIKRFFAINFKEHWGLVLGYQYALKKMNAIEPYLFYEMQFTNSHTRNEFVNPVAIDDNGTVYYVKRIVLFGPTIALGNYVGIGINIPLLDYLSISQKAGFGITLFYNTDPSFVFENNRSQEFGYILSFGIMYRLKNNKVE